MIAFPWRLLIVPNQVSDKKPLERTIMCLKHFLTVYIVLLCFAGTKPIYGSHQNKIYENVRVVSVQLSVVPGSLVSTRGHLIPTLRWDAEGLEPIVRKEACDKDKFQTEYKSLKKKIRCQPRETVVELSLNDANVGGNNSELNGLSNSRIIPNVVVVKRCGGLCGGRKTCLSSEQKYKTFYVKTFKDSRVHCLGVQVAEDVKCRCGCDTRKSQCTPQQTYDKNNCTCVCKNKTEQLICVKSGGNNKRWDEKTCSCSCRKSQPCTTGTVWSTEECRCIREILSNQIWS